MWDTLLSLADNILKDQRLLVPLPKDTGNVKMPDFEMAAGGLQSSSTLPRGYRAQLILGRR